MKKNFLNIIKYASSIRLIIKFMSIVLMLCLNSGIAFAQLEFSNWIGGENTIIHINMDGTTELKTYNGIASNDTHNDLNEQLISTKEGKPILKISNKNAKFDGHGMNNIVSITSLNGEELFPELHTRAYSLLPFILKSPDNKYVYAIYSSYSLSYKGLEEYYKTQIRCFCKNNSDETDKGKDFLLNEFEGFFHQNVNEIYPFFCGFSHTDNKSVWIISEIKGIDSVATIKISGDKITEKKSHIFI
ncbi:MAG: hypothetical protein II937_11970 [Bacteroidales bacterium]|nr:hypothetical protein [Bacteroidales bacterium]